MEMDQRVNLLTERLDVISDLLTVLKGELTHGHGEKLEWIGEFSPLLSGNSKRIFTNTHQSSSSSQPKSS